MKYNYKYASKPSTRVHLCQFLSKTYKEFFYCLKKKKKVQCLYLLVAHFQPLTKVLEESLHKKINSTVPTFLAFSFVDLLCEGSEDAWWQGTTGNVDER